ncbi:MAG: EFR1 family ferrodoxin [Spirochaetaceae bacterium]|jgi:ferredoxin|nr:EFR1 family ferrodoxin [Spirochaetaceae bacterium]
MKLIYFSGTGNSLYAAKRLGGELLAVQALQKSGIYEITGPAVGIICPVYGFTVPYFVREYLEKATIRSDYVFAVMTFGNSAMAALGCMKEILEKRGAALHYGNEIKMVDNYLPLFEMSRQAAMGKEERFELELDRIIQDIQERKQVFPRHSLFKRLVSSAFSALWENKQAMARRDKGFIITDRCNACGTCRKLCPAGNIAGTGKPVYKGRCAFCLGCIHLCPQNAIHLKNERSGKRFRNPHVTAAELIQGNTGGGAVKAL